MSDYCTINCYFVHISAIFEMSTYKFMIVVCVCLCMCMCMCVRGEGRGGNLWSGGRGGGSDCDEVHQVKIICLLSHFIDIKPNGITHCSPPTRWLPSLHPLPTHTSLSLSLSLSHTHTHTLTLTLSL